MNRLRLKEVAKLTRRIGRRLEQLAGDMMEVSRVLNESRQEGDETERPWEAQVRRWSSADAVTYIRHGLCSAEDRAILEKDLPRRLKARPNDPYHLELQLELSSK